MFRNVPGYATLQETTSPGSVSVAGAVSLFGRANAARGLGCACQHAEGLGFAPGGLDLSMDGGVPWWLWAAAGVGLLWLVTHPGHVRAERKADMASAKAAYLRRRAAVKRGYSVRAQAADWVGV